MSKHRHPPAAPLTPPDPRPLAGYAVLLGGYGALAGLGTFLVRKRGVKEPPLDLKRLVLFALATEHLSRVIAKDSILSFLRSPFTSYLEATGEGEVNEEVVGEGVRHAFGELITCPFCLAQWVATGLVVGSALAPNFTTALATACALARTSDYLQLAYDHVKAHA